VDSSYHLSLDTPLHEFLPQEENQQKEIAYALGITLEKSERKS
jgi:hypothetical protein